MGRRKIRCGTFFISTKWWLTRFGFLTIILLNLAVNAQQVLQTERFEIASSRDEEDFEVIPAFEDGIFLYRGAISENNHLIQLIKLDTAFHESWSGYLPVERDFVLMGKKNDGEKLHFLLRYRDFSRNDFQLFSIENKTGLFNRYIIKNFIPFTPTEFQVTSEAAIIGGYYNQVPVVIFYSFKTQKAKVLPGLLNESGELTQLKVYPNGTFDVLICARNFTGQKTVFIKTYDAAGDLVRNYAMATEDNRHLIFARSMKTGEDQELVAGVFGGKNSLYSRGLFLASINYSGEQQLRYYNYGDLENFFKYMKAKREARVKSRIERRKIKGKRVRFNYRFLVHEIVPYKNQYILLGEAFYPKYISTDRSNPYTFFSSGSRGPGPIMRDGRIFDGYYYTHAVVMGFDLNGKLLWDNSFEINDVRTFTLEQFVKLEVKDDRITLLYLFQNELRTKIIQDNQVLEGKTLEPIRTNSDKDIVRRDPNEVNRLDYWYKDVFYAYGIQDISNSSTGRRRVFFINKVSCP